MRYDVAVCYAHNRYLKLKGIARKCQEHGLLFALYDTRAAPVWFWEGLF